MELIKRLCKKHQIRNYRPIITKESIQRYKKSAKRVEPKGYNLSNKPLSELISAGASMMKKDNFKIASEGLRNL